MIVIIRAGKGVEKFCYSTLPVTVILQLTNLLQADVPFLYPLKTPEVF